MEETINKIIGIGKSRECSVEELRWFLPSFPFIEGDEFVVSKARDTAIVEKFVKENIKYYIRGLHIIELKYMKLTKKSEWGFGSRSCTYSLILKLYQTDPKLADTLGEWIAYNGGNFNIDACKQNMFEREKCVPNWRLTKEDIRLLLESLNNNSGQ